MSRPEPRLCFALLGLAIFGLCGPMAAPPLFADDDPVPTVGVFQSLGDRATLTEIVLPGRVLSWCPWPGEGEPDGSDLAVLVASGEEEDSPRQLYRVRGLAEDIRPLVDSLPAEIDAVAAPAPSAGRSGDIWLGAEGVIYRLAEGSDGHRLELLLESPGLDLGSLRRRGLVRDGGLTLTSVGRLQFFELDAEGKPQHTGELPLPIEVRRRRTGLELSGLAVSRIGGTGKDDQAPLYVAGPDHLGDHRNRHLLIDPSAAAATVGDEGEGNVDEENPAVRETFTLFDDPESIESHRYLLLDGRPALVATTSKANKLGIFEEQKARVFRLAADRTRAGKRPMLLAETETKKWFQVGMEVLDYDRDGKEDLVLIQPEGMGGGELIVELYRGRGGSFDRRSRKTKLDHDASDWHFGHDFDGDGKPDLLLLSGRLHIYRGLPGTGRKLLDKKPWSSLSTGGESRTVVSAGEGTEIVNERGSLRGDMRLVGEGGEGPAKAVIVRHRGDDERLRAVVRIVDFGANE